MSVFCFVPPPPTSTSNYVDLNTRCDALSAQTQISRQTQARPPSPRQFQKADPTKTIKTNGMFSSPWSGSFLFMSKQNKTKQRSFLLVVSLSCRSLFSRFVLTCRMGSGLVLSCLPLYSNSPRVCVSRSCLRLESSVSLVYVYIQKHRG